MTLERLDEISVMTWISADVMSFWLLWATFTHIKPILTTFDHLLDCRGTFIVPSFDEIWPQPGKERAGKARTRMGYDYILEAMQVSRVVLVMILMKILGKIIFLMMLMIMATHKAINILPQLDGDLENDSADVLEVILDPHNGLGKKQQ